MNANKRAVAISPALLGDRVFNCITATMAMLVALTALMG
jgi:hypothetical protein